MLTALHPLTAAIYLLAGLTGCLGLALARPRFTRVAVGLLAAGALVHGLWFSLLHTADPTPSLTDAGAATSFMAWVGTLSFLLLLWRAKLSGLVALVAPMAFLGVFVAALQMGAIDPTPMPDGGTLPHAHVLLASAGLSLLGLAGLAGVLYLTEHRRLKRKLPLVARHTLPSLEALDRVNAASLALGFLLLTLGVITGGLWVRSMHGAPWTGTVHETGWLISWLIYAVLVTLRFAVHQGARQCAASAIGGFAVLVCALVGAELLA